MSHKKLNSNLVEAQMNHFYNVDFSNSQKVMKELSHITNLINQGYRVPIETIEMTLMENGYDTFIDIELNEKYKDKYILTYMFNESNVDEVIRYLISLWMQQLLDYELISLELQSYFTLYEEHMRFIDELNMETKQKIKALK